MDFAGLICAYLKIMVLLVFLPDWPRVGYIMSRWWMDNSEAFLFGVLLLFTSGQFCH